MAAAPSSPATLPLFGTASPPPARATLAGWAREDAIEISDPGNPGRWRRGRVIAVLHNAHELTLRVGDTIISINPLVHGALLRRPISPGNTPQA